MHINRSPILSVPLFLLALALLTLTAPPAANGSHTSRLAGLEWRMIGPYRGGRVTTVEIRD